jgi:hypothetical protein
MEALLGTDCSPPERLQSDIGYRRGYYYASYRFVSHLIGLAGMETFLRLYDSARPGAAFVNLYGRDRAALAAETLR